MMHYGTIGKNYATTLRVINDPVSEYYVPPAVEAMDCTMLQRNAQLLTDQVAMWAEKLNGADRKSAANISAILDNQNAKLEAYQQLIESKCQAGNGPGPKYTPDQQPAPVSEAPGGEGGTPWLMIGGAALLLILLMKRN